MDLLDFQTIRLKCTLKNKKFISVANVAHYANIANSANNTTFNIIRFQMKDIFIPFGCELYNDKYIVNLEFLKTNNTHNNYLSVLQNLENMILNKNFSSEVSVDGI